jgi:hypothetical protein
LPYFLSRASAHIGSVGGFAPLPVRPAMVDRAVRPASSVLPKDEPLLLGALGSTDVASSDLVDAASDTSQLREEKPSAFRGHVEPPSSPEVKAPGTATGGIRWSVLLASVALCGAMLTLYVSRRRGQGPSWLVRRWGSWRRKTVPAPPAANSAPGATP